MFENGKIKIFESSDFRDGYKDKLERELAITGYPNEMWAKVHIDPKLDKFKEILTNNSNKKMVVFTESKQTALYLERSLEKFNVLCVHGGNRDKLKDIIRENFDANYDEKNKKTITMLSLNRHFERGSQYASQ